MSVKITQFEAENIKRIKAVTITPAENGLTVIGGRNGQGKTSGLDAIMWALGGDRFRPSMPQREGSVLPPRLRVELSNGLVVERTGKNSDLKVTDPSGKRHGQQILNTFVETLALDLPKFMAATGKEKAATLLRIIGMEEQVNALERQEKDLYNQRRAVGQIAEQKAKYAKELPYYPDAPSAPVSAYELIQRQQEILARNGENQKKRDHLAEISWNVDTLTEEVRILEGKLAEKKHLLADALHDQEIARTAAADLQDESTAELEENLRQIETVNAKVRTNMDKARADAEAKQYNDQYDGLTAQIEATRKEKTDLLHGANLPLPELSVENGELTYQGKPWDCMSGSDQLKVSAAIVKALNPECGFILMDKLEQMDLETLKEFGDWMEDQGLQGIATRVSTGPECSIIISDGMAAGTTEKPVQNAAPAWRGGHK